jgi:hypothetical protein
MFCKLSASRPAQRVIAVFVIVAVIALLTSSTYAAPMVSSSGKFIGTFRAGGCECAADSQCNAVAGVRQALNVCPEQEAPGFVNGVSTWGDNTRCMSGVCVSDQYWFPSCSAAGISLKP